jgi:hypothetical protein
MAWERLAEVRTYCGSFLPNGGILSFICHLFFIMIDFFLLMPLWLVRMENRFCNTSRCKFIEVNIFIIIVIIIIIITSLSSSPFSTSSTSSSSSLPSSFSSSPSPSSSSSSSTSSLPSSLPSSFSSSSSSSGLDAKYSHHQLRYHYTKNKGFLFEALRDRDQKP